VSESLGRIDKPSADAFKDKRKLMTVFLVFEHSSAPEEYREKCARYWQQVGEHLGHLEARLGLVRHVYHESVDETGAEGLESLASLYPSSHALAKPRVEAGAALEALEDSDLAKELNDWERFMMLGFSSSKVASLARDMYSTALRSRNQHATGVIDSTLAGDEVGLLFMREGSSLQFPADVEVFSVVPPALDEIHRWIREASQQTAEAQQDDGTEVDFSAVAEADSGEEAQ